MNSIKFYICMWLLVACTAPVTATPTATAVPPTPTVTATATSGQPFTASDRSGFDLDIRIEETGGNSSVCVVVFDVDGQTLLWHVIVSLKSIVEPEHYAQLWMTNPDTAERCFGTDMPVGLDSGQYELDVFRYNDVEGRTDSLLVWTPDGESTTMVFDIQPGEDWFITLTLRGENA